MAGWLAAPAGGGFDARSVTEAADEIERLRAEVEAWRSLDKVRLETIRQGLTEMRRLQALIDTLGEARTLFNDDPWTEAGWDAYTAARNALFAAATPKEDVP
jgi:hypothetical protein